MGTDRAGVTRCRHCPRCDVNWPPDAEFEACPKCEQTTAPRAGEPHVSLKEARFERVYTEHERNRRERGDLDPDTLGVLDAREQLDVRR